MDNITKNSIATINEMRAILSNPKAWAQGAAARDKNAVGVPPASPNAVCWCLMGAKNKAHAKLKTDSGVTTNDVETSKKVYNALKSSLMYPYMDPVQFNDSRTTTHSDVLGLLDRAKAILEGCP